MAIEIVMPKLGWTMEEGILDEWIKQDGDEVQPGDIIFIVESDKALQEIEAFDGGILRISPDAPPVGSTVKIGETLAYLVEPGEAPPFEGLKAEDDAPTMDSSAVELSEVASTSTTTKQVRRSHGDRPAISPRAKRVALELGIDWTMLTGSGSSERIVERDVRAAADMDINISPVARRVAHAPAHHRRRTRASPELTQLLDRGALHEPPLLGQGDLGEHHDQTSRRVRFRKDVNRGTNPRLIVPVGPFRCLATITSAMPSESVPGL